MLTSRRGKSTENVDPEEPAGSQASVSLSAVEGTMQRIGWKGEPWPLRREKRAVGGASPGSHATLPTHPESGHSGGKLRLSLESPGRARRPYLTPQLGRPGVKLKELGHPGPHGGASGPTRSVSFTPHSLPLCPATVKG